MDVTTDFEAWLDCQEFNYEEIYSLYQSVAKIEDWSLFSTTSREISGGKTQYFVKSDCCDEQLLLASDKAKDAFLRHIEKKYCTDGMDIESWYGYQHACHKDD